MPKSTSDAETVTFSNIPEGVTYEVLEDDYSSEGYTTSYNFPDTGKKIAAGDSDTVTITNNKQATIDTGVVLDSIPYILVAAAVIAVAVFMTVRRRRNKEV